MHYLMMISENPRMIFQAEILVKSIKRFSGNKPCDFTLVIQGDDMGPIKIPIPIDKIDKFSNSYLNYNAEVLYTPYYWELGSPCRFFVKPRSQTCVMIDVDVIACKDLSPIYDLDPDCIHGVTAFKRHLDDVAWSSIGMGEDDRDFYFNMGMLVIPSCHLETLGNSLIDLYPKIQRLFPQQAYFSGQISLSLAIKRMKLKKNKLPQEYNWFDMIPYSEMKDTPLFLHYFYHKNHNANLPETFSKGSSEIGYKKLLQKSAITLI